ncbi:hypothetical protein AB0M28_13680 [Streptomyces sp. NPDC051940]|uniref:hypothetical protein n=1 Tax=Streptomyces sp. NPDC051940 TaxID=3155675 RepID=UPI00342814C3
MADRHRYRLAWLSARRRAKRRQPHEREGLIFHLERQNTRLHAFANLANEAAQASSRAWEQESGEVARLREQVAQMRSGIALCPSNAPSGEPDTAHYCALPEGHAVPLHQSEHGTVWTEEDAAERRPVRVPTVQSAEVSPGELVVYRAEYEHEITPLGLYTTREAARAHCEAHIRREWPPGTALSFDWIRDDEDPLNPEELYVTAGQNEESTTGYLVTPLTVASECDEEADE